MNDLPKNAANHVPLSPLSFLQRAARIYPQKTAIVDGSLHVTYGLMHERVTRLASALQRLGVGKGDVVSVLAPNSAPMLEAHYGVPLAAAVLNAINTRLDAATVAHILDHAEAKVFLVDSVLAPVAAEALALREGGPITVVDLPAPAAETNAPIGSMDYDALLASGDPSMAWRLPDDEWQSITLNYTSGTTGNPKGALYSHRGAHLNAVGNALAVGLSDRTKYLWTLPMFHCNGWCYTWAVTAVGGTHVCLRQVVPREIFRLIAEQSITHMCGAPVVLTMLIHAPEADRRPLENSVRIVTGGAAPPSAVIAGMEGMGFEVEHHYGLTESCGPSVHCAIQEEWADLPLPERAVKMARQGVPHHLVADATVGEKAADGLGEILLRSNTLMKGYLKNPDANAAAFADGWFHSGDLGVLHEDGYIEVKDRAKDIIISGGENISSLEVEEVLYNHPAVMEAAVVASPHEKWGETPVAFVTLREGAGASEADIIGHCRKHMAHFKVPTRVVFGPLPKTSTGKIQKFELRSRVAAT